MNTKPNVMRHWPLALIALLLQACTTTRYVPVPCPPLLPLAPALQSPLPPAGSFQACLEELRSHAPTMPACETLRKLGTSSSP